MKTKKLRLAGRIIAVFTAFLLTFAGVSWNPLPAEAAGVTTVSSYAALLTVAENSRNGQNYAGETVRLSADIRIPAGTVWPGILGFAGTFDGAGHSIAGLQTSSVTANDPQGLFSTTSNGAVIQNLILKDGAVNGVNSVGALVGCQYGTLTVTDVQVRESVSVTAAYHLGGLIGRAEGTVAVTNTWSAASVESAAVGSTAAAGSAGGLIGWVHAGANVTLTGSAYTGTVTRAGGNFFGGLIATVYGREDAHASIRIVSSASSLSLTGTAGTPAGFVGGAMNNSGAYVEIAILNSCTSHPYAVSSSLESSLLSEDLNYWANSNVGGSVMASVKYIAFPAQLVGLAHLSKKYGFSGRTLELTKDLDVSGYGDWPMFGSDSLSFYGTIDGQGHTVSGLRVSVAKGSDGVGRAGFIARFSGGTVRDLTISGSTFTSAGSFAGAAVAQLTDGGTVSKVHVTGTVSVSANDQAGGVVGRVGGGGGSITECWSEAAVSLLNDSVSTRAAGGILGASHAATSITSCLFTGSVNARDGAAGGIFGTTRDVTTAYVEVSDSVSAGRLSGAIIGGITGTFMRIYRQNWGGSSYPVTYSIHDCYAAPALKAVGSLNNGFADASVTATTVSSSLSALYGTACSGLNTAKWEFRTNAVPMLKAFTSVPYTQGSIPDAVPGAPVLTVREAFYDVPDPSGCTFKTEDQSIGETFLRQYDVTGSGNPLTSYIPALQSAGWTLQSGNDGNPAWSTAVFGGVVMTKGDRILFLSYYDVDAGRFLRVGVTLKTEKDFLTGTSLFTGVPGVSGQNPSAEDVGGGVFQKTYTGVAKSNYDTVSSGLISNGFTKVADNGSGLFGKVYTSSYQKDTRTVTLIFVSSRSELYVTAGEDLTLSPHLDSTVNWAADANVYEHELMVIPEQTLTSTDPESLTSRNSFVIRMKNGHFIVNDGGLFMDGEPLVELLESLAPKGQKPVVEGWFISHSHADHAGALVQLGRDAALRDRIRVDGIYYNAPNLAVHALDPLVIGFTRGIEKTASMLKTSTGGTPAVYRNRTGEKYYFSGLNVDILFAQEQVPIAEYSGDFNDSSTLIRVNMSGQTVGLFGDADAGTVRRLVGFNSLGLNIQKFYTVSDLTFTMRTLLHHGHNESNTFTNGTSYEVLLMTCRTDNLGGSSWALTDNNKAACDYARSKATEEINPNETRYLSFPYAVGSALVPTDISSYRGETYTAPAAPTGKIFGGWFYDDVFTVPVPETVTEGKAFAKFVDKNVLQVMYQQDYTVYPDGTKRIRIVTTVDDLSYSKVGFRLTYKNSSGTTVTRSNSSPTVYQRLNWFKDGEENYYLPTVFSSESRSFCCFKLIANAGIVLKNGAGFTAQAFWVTADGTTVYGDARNDLKFAAGLQEMTGDGEDLTLEE